MALRNGMSPSTPLNGCEIKCTFLLCLIYKNSYVLSKFIECIRNVRIGSFFNALCNNAVFELLFVMVNQKLDFGCSRSSNKI